MVDMRSASATQLDLLQPLFQPLKPLADIPPLFSFFSGAGFLDLGLIRAGFRIAWSLEADPRVCTAHNFGMKSYFEAAGEGHEAPLISAPDKIQHKGPQIILREATGSFGRGDDFGIVGGPPCPDFSIGGKNRGEQGEQGRLTRIFVERICELEPQFFLIENVKGLISTRKHRVFLLGELWKLEEKGFAVDFAVLNALNLGVPQDRERVFIVGVKRSLIKTLYSRRLKKGERHWFPWPRDTRYENAKTRFRWPTTSAFGSTPVKPEGIPEELCVGPLIMNQAEIARLPNGTECFKPYSEKFYLIAEGDDSRKCFKRLHRYRYSPTAAYGNNEVHLHPALPRRLNVREAMRIQTVPDTFALPAELPLSTKFKIVGNGVPVELARRVGLALRAFLAGDSVLIPMEARTSDNGSNQTRD
jgi:DNA (cytosine-5)-methyltransferase 1